MPSRGNRHANAFLYRYAFTDPTMTFVQDLLAREERDIPSPEERAAIVDIALFGIDEQQWTDAVIASRLQFKLERISRHFPMLSVTDQPIEADGARHQVWQGQPLRPNVLEESMGIPISTQDMQLFLDALQLLPSGWSLVLEISREV